jgi:hypothetical protein
MSIILYFKQKTTYSYSSELIAAKEKVKNIRVRKEVYADLAQTSYKINLPK